MKAHTAAPARLDEEAAEALAVLAHAHRLQGDPARAALLLQALELLRPNEPAVLRALAAAELAQGQAAAALAALERLALLGVVDGAFHLLRSQALVGVGRADEARAAMHAWMALRAAARDEPAA